MKIGVIGAGSWGTAISYLLSENGHKVTLWSYSKEQALNIIENRENKNFLPNIILNEDIKVTYFEEDLTNNDLIILAVPSKFVRQTCERFKKYLNSNTIILNLAKGLEEGSFLRLSEVIEEVFPEFKVAVLTGPSHAEEVAKKMLTFCVVSSKYPEICNILKEVFKNEYFKVFINLDLVGVEIGGALKNLIALVAGVLDGLGFGDNAKAALMTLGMSEISRLGVAMGANKDTFFGLTGIGDLIVTCTSEHSRNRSAGLLIAQGKSLNEILDEIKMVVEGISVTETAYKLSLKYEIDMPITKTIYRTLFDNENFKEIFFDLMSKEIKYGN